MGKHGSRPKLTAAQQRAVDEILAHGKLFRAFYPSHGTRGFLVFSDGPTSRIRFATYESLVKIGVVEETGYFPMDATEGPSTCNGRAGNGRYALLNPALFPTGSED